MRIVVIGTRGIPGILGGVETHCEELFPRIAAADNEVYIIRRSCYIDSSNKCKEYKGVKLIDTFAPRKKSIEAIVHTFLAIIKARTLNPDIVHVHAIGPAILIPFARLLGMKVVMTNHGPDYDRQKWGKIAKFILKSGEFLGTKFSNEVIVISPTINNILRSKYKRNDCNLIFNGVNIPIKSNNTDYIESLEIKPKKYIVAVGRFVKEKGFDLLIEAFSKIDHKDIRLVIAGDADHQDEYSGYLKDLARKNNVVLTGFIKGEELNQILTNALLFILPSFHEGLPISLLEAMSYNIDTLVSNIPANTLPCLSPNDYFVCGDCDSLQKMILNKLNNTQIHREYDLTPYNWDTIAKQTIQVYSKYKKPSK